MKARPDAVSRWRSSPATISVLASASSAAVTGSSRTRASSAFSAASTSAMALPRATVAVTTIEPSSSMESARKPAFEASCER